MTVEKRTVLLFDTPCTITIFHSSKTVWVAVGDYKGERMEVKGSSANTAAKNWLDEAHIRGAESGVFRCRSAAELLLGRSEQETPTRKHHPCW